MEGRIRLAIADNDAITLAALRDTDPTNSQAQQIRECGYDPLHKADGIIGAPKR